MLSDVYSKKQIEVLRYALKNDFFMLVNHGAKRSGKTILDNDIFLCELRRVKQIANADGVKKPQYILAGADLASIRRNVLSELENKYGLTFQFDKANRFDLLGVKVCCFGHSKINDMSRIRGMTAYGAYINEASMANEQVFNEIRTRCTGDGARIIMDTNPDRPGHWLKKNYIDRADGGTITAFKWRLDDNSFLSRRAIDAIKASTPNGVFYDRDILGEWVSPDGLVYAEFSESHIVETAPGMRRYFAGLDFGWEHPGALCLAGEGDDGRYYVLKTWSAKHRSIDDWAGILAGVYNEYGHIPVYCDSARPDMISELQAAGFDAMNARKDVLAGIGYVASLIHTHDLLFLSAGIGDDFRAEIEAYSWKTDADEPQKLNDDIMDAMRYALYTDHIRRTEEPRPVLASYLRGGII